MKLLSLSLLLTSLTAVAVPWDKNNDIENLRDLRDFEYRLSELPKNGRNAKRVWTGSWWPLREGGLAKVVSGGMSPLEKLEKVDPLARGALRWERKFNERNRQFKWGGHCNGLAVAGIVEEEPKRSVVYGGVRFTPEEIKGLLLEVYQGPMPVVGDRCEKRKNQFARDRYGRVADRACQDLNAGTFHIALGNYLGLHSKPIIIDTSTHNVVWNWPAYKYSSTVKELSARQANKVLGVGNRGQYEFNMNATRFYSVVSKVHTMDQKTRTYRYILEVDSQGKIIGGEWVGDSRTNHPDFLWRPDGTSVENPYIAPVIYTILHIADKSR